MTFTKFDVEIRSYDENRNEHAEGKFAFYLNLDKEMSHVETSTWMMNQRFKGQLSFLELYRIWNLILK